MTKDIINKLSRFKGERVEKVIDEITKIAKGYTINVMDPEFNDKETDNEPERLNIKTNKSGKITGFTTG